MNQIYQLINFKLYFQAKDYKNSNSMSSFPTKTLLALVKELANQHKSLIKNHIFCERIISLIHCISICIDAMYFIMKIILSYHPNITAPIHPCQFTLCFQLISTFPFSCYTHFILESIVIPEAKFTLISWMETMFQTLPYCDIVLL